jgi:hypothetical protein
MLAPRTVYVILLLVSATSLPLACSVKPQFFDDRPGGGGAGGDDGIVPETPCTTVADCPGMDGVCFKRACVKGICHPDLVPRGTALPMQQRGDCQATICDGLGKEISQTNVIDVPADSNECTLDLCTDGKPSHAFATTAQTCGLDNKFHCNGNGACTCTSNAECGVPGPCFSWSCNQGSMTCEKVFRAPNTPTAQQTDDDCQATVCNSTGGEIQIADISDAPDDKTLGDCKKPGCSVAGEIIVENNDADRPPDEVSMCTVGACSNGMPDQAPAADNASCGNCLWCQQGGCVPCDQTRCPTTCTPP